VSSKIRKHPHPAPSADSLFRQALALHQQGNLKEAERLYRQVLEQNAHHADSLHLLGMIGYKCGHPEPALQLINQAIALKPDEAVYHSNLGVVMNSLGKLDEAIQSYQRAVALRPAYPEAHSNMAHVLVTQGKYSDAVAHFERAIALNPDNADAYVNLGVTFAEMGDPQQAIPHYQRALALNPELAVAYSNLGNAWKDAGKLDEAVACFQRAITIKPDYLTAFYNLGNTYQALNQLDEALKTYARASSIQHDYAEATYGTALAQLLDGNFVDGWHNYESRWTTHGHKPVRPYPYPRWKGNKLASGHLLLWGEQGIGDEIMFAGLIPELSGTGHQEPAGTVSEVILDCDARLLPLFRRSFPGLHVVTGFDAARPSDPKIAAHLPTGSLPRFFRTSELAFCRTASPYLMSDRTRRNQFRSRYAWGKKVAGIAWHTKNAKTGRSRSMPLAQFAPLLQRTEIFWVSLQYGDHEDLEKQSSTAQVPLFIDREVDQFQDLDLFAAQVAAMDLVITIDNSTAHLAGALGVPVWLMLPFDRDWRWLQERADSPWYPTMRIFRQAAAGDWTPVIAAVSEALG